MTAVLSFTTTDLLLTNSASALILFLSINKKDTLFNAMIRNHTLAITKMEIKLIKIVAALKVVRLGCAVQM